MIPTLETTICANVETCIETFEYEATTDPKEAGANLLACTTEVIDTLPKDKKQDFICSLLDKVHPPPIRAKLEKKLEAALNNITRSYWDCKLVADEFKPCKLVYVYHKILCRRSINNNCCHTMTTNYY